MDDSFPDSLPLRFLKIKLFLSKKEWEGKFNSGMTKQLNLWTDLIHGEENRKACTGDNGYFLLVVKKDEN